MRRKIWGFSIILGYSRTRYLKFTTVDTEYPEITVMVENARVVAIPKATNIFEDNLFIFPICSPCGFHLLEVEVVVGRHPDPLAPDGSVHFRSGGLVVGPVGPGMSDRFASRLDPSS